MFLIPRVRDGYGEVPLVVYSVTCNRDLDADHLGIMSIRLQAIQSDHIGVLYLDGVMQG